MEGGTDEETEVDLRRELSPVVQSSEGGAEVKKDKYLAFVPDNLMKQHGPEAQENHDFLGGIKDNHLVLCIPFSIKGNHVRIGIGCPTNFMGENGQQRNDWRRFYWKWKYKKADKQFKVIVWDQEAQTERAIFSLWQSDRNAEFKTEVQVEDGSLNVLGLSAMAEW